RAPSPASLPAQLDPPARPTLSPYTTLFRSSRRNQAEPNKRDAPRLYRRHNHLHLGCAPDIPVAPGISETGKGKQWRLNQFQGRIDRKSTRLNSSHVKISYAVFCLKKKKERD